MAESALRLERLGRHHDRRRFSCGEPELDRYLWERARQDADRRVAAVYVLAAVDSGEIAGYFTLSAAEVEPSSLPPEIARRLPRYPALPVTLLGRLAVDRSRQGAGMGRALLIRALGIAFDRSTDVAAMGVVVDILNERARAFYKRHEFRPLVTDARRLILPMTTVARLLGR